MREYLIILSPCFKAGVGTSATRLVFNHQQNQLQEEYKRMVTIRVDTSYGGIPLIISYEPGVTDQISIWFRADYVSKK